MVEAILLNIGASAVAILLAFFSNRRSSEEQKKAEARIKEAEDEARTQPEKSKPAWDLARATLTAYFDRNLRQISMIFWLSVFVMLAGFAIISTGLFWAFQNPASVSAASLSVGAGVLTEFTGATFLFIYRSTIQQAIDYCRTLERINSVGMAMQILDTMPNTVGASDIKSRTKARLVETLAHAAGGLPRASPAFVSSSVRQPRKSRKAPSDAGDKTSETPE